MAAGREWLVHIAGGIRLDRADNRGQVGQSRGPDGVSKVDRDGPAASAVSLASLDGFGIAFPFQVAVPPDELRAGGDPPSGASPVIPPWKSLNLFQLSIPPGYPAPRGEAEMRAIVEEFREKLAGMLPMLDPSKGPGMTER
jgi:hypothetical protein